jgi:hypothetical protein
MKSHNIIVAFYGTYSTSAMEIKIVSRSPDKNTFGTNCFKPFGVLWAGHKCIN